VHISYLIPGSMCVAVTVCFGWGGVVSLCRLKCGMWGLGVNGRLEYWVCFSWALLWNESAFVVEGLDIVLFVRQ
jgi:hypothetical protein